MPTYEYACLKCGIFELFQSMTADPISKCPTCRRKVKRQIGTGAGLIFKGSGFYTTDYRSDSYKKAAKTDSTAPAPAAATPAPAPAASTPAPAAPAAPAKTDKKKT
jgi:putative FmdB family regulatory protein